MSEIFPCLGDLGPICPKARKKPSNCSPAFSFWASKNPSPSFESPGVEEKHGNIFFRHFYFFSAPWEAIRRSKNKSWSYDFLASVDFLSKFVILDKLAEDCPQNGSKWCYFPHNIQPYHFWPFSGQKMVFFGNLRKKSNPGQKLVKTTNWPFFGPDEAQMASTPAAKP